MANIVVNDSPTFSIEMESIETSTPAHADVLNTRYAQMLGNELYLKKKLDVGQITIPASSWQGSAAPYTATVDVADITADSRPEIYLYYPDTITTENYEDYVEAYGYINKADTGTGTITFTCFGDRPAIDLTLSIKGY